MPSTTNPAVMILLAVARACVLMVPGVAFLAGDVFLLEIYQGYVAWKHFAFRILVEVAVGAWCLLALIEPRYRPRFSWPQLRAALDEAGCRQVRIVVGGVIPPEDYDALRDAGASLVFGPGTVIGKAALELLDELEGS